MDKTHRESALCYVVRPTKKINTKFSMDIDVLTDKWKRIFFYNSKLETRNSKLETRNSELETHLFIQLLNSFNLRMLTIASVGTATLSSILMLRFDIKYILLIALCATIICRFMRKKSLGEISFSIWSSVMLRS
jgi:hypothetical protein